MTVSKTVFNKGLKQSSRNWVRRQINDPYVALARTEGYRSRAAFKLLEIQKKFRIIRKESVVVDLGAAPGSWSQVASTLCNDVVAVDLLDIVPLPNVSFVYGDFLEEETIGRILSILGDRRPDVVLSDMAPNTCGVKKVDHIRIMNLVEAVYRFCEETLAHEGTMVVKTFQGGASADVLHKMKSGFKTVKHFKPLSSRKESSELYVVSTGFRVTAGRENQDCLERP
ncbi:MAG: RlmE family RNA methyltransferase [Holosporales bacterium]|jgi:23S rRNA (uridine2552-2'-O)-methyltransferase|nr:RlmE family RNA methyltransferase [Holosporales bacterium]